MAVREGDRVRLTEGKHGFTAGACGVVRTVYPSGDLLIEIDEAADGTALPSPRQIGPVESGSVEVGCS